jgi:hypothetical protein
MHHEAMMATMVVVGVAQYIVFSCDEIKLHLINNLDYLSITML